MKCSEVIECVQNKAVLCEVDERRELRVSKHIGLALLKKLVDLNVLGLVRGESILDEEGLLVFKN